MRLSLASWKTRLLLQLAPERMEMLHLAVLQSFRQTAMHKPQCLLTVLPVVRVRFRSCIRYSSWLCASCLLILCCFGIVNISPPQECRPVQLLSLLVLPLQPVITCLCYKKREQDESGAFGFSGISSCLGQAREL